MLGRIGTLVLVVALAAAVAAGCTREVGGAGDGGQGAEDAAQRACPAGTTPLVLDGGFTCGESACGAGQLCIPWPASRDGSVFSHECVDLPTGCPACECDYSECAVCIGELCGGYVPPGSEVPGSVQGRTLNCPYPQ
jgi:hypothetical protein